MDTTAHKQTLAPWRGSAICGYVALAGVLLLAGAIEGWMMALGGLGLLQLGVTAWAGGLLKLADYALDWTRRWADRLGGLTRVVVGRITDAAAQVVPLAVRRRQFARAPPRVRARSLPHVCLSDRLIAVPQFARA